MNLHPFEIESINASISQNHRDALRVYQARIAANGRPRPMTTAMLNLRASIGSMLISAGEILRHEPDPCPGMAPCVR